MQVACVRCQKSTEYSGAPPRFCSHCGAAFQVTDPREAETLTGTEPMSVEVAGTGANAGDRVGPYRLGRELGRGGMGVVFEAEQQGTGRVVALKLLPRSTQRTEETVQRFLREGQVAASLSHSRSTFVYTAGQDHDQFYIAMELMPQGTIREVVDRDGPLATQRAVDYILDVMEGLTAAHAMGIVHRDVKPSNCFLDHEGRVKVGDFGISKLLFGDAALTRTGAFVGTPQFAAPEQIRGGAVDHRTDVYAVGATLFFLLTARAPFDGDAISVVADIASQPAPLLRSILPQVPRGLERAVARCLEKEPQRRPQDLNSLRLALLPFSSRGASMANLGRRMAAYFIDMLCVAVLLPLVSIAVLITWLVFASGSLEPTRLSRVMMASSAGFFVAYFSLCEWKWGCGFGKRILGLRVVNFAGETPGIGRTLLRALCLPGIVQLSAQFVALVFVNPAESPDMLPVERAMAVIYSQSGTVVGWILTLALLSTMRKANGYRGIHEIVSGTQVVRHRSPTTERRIPVPVTLPIAIEGGETLGNYQLVGTFGESHGVSLFGAFDNTLERPVWIYRGPVDRWDLTNERIGIARSARSHWLDRGLSNDQAWDAMEAVRGGPCWDLTRERGGIPWQDGRVILHELSEELKTAASDGTLPRELSFSQVWVDQAGRLKLLEIPIAAPPDERVMRSIAGTDEERAAGLLVTTAQEIVRNQSLPGHAQDFVSELEHRPKDRHCLQWAAEQLPSMLDRPAAIKWDDRLGHLAISFGLETAVYYLVVTTLALGLAILPQMTPALNFWLTLLPVLALPCLLGAWFRGGPVFTVAGVVVRRKDGQTASRLRCGLRSLVAWSPSIVANSLLMLGAMQFILSPAQDVTFDSAAAAIVFTLMMASAGLLYLLHLAGGIVCLLRPNRGLQDVIAGTQLVQK